LQKSIAFSASSAVAALDDLLQDATAHDQPAVRCGISGGEAQHANRRLFPAAGIEQPLQRNRRHQGRVGIDDEHRAAMP